VLRGIGRRRSGTPGSTLFGAFAGDIEPLAAFPEAFAADAQPLRELCFRALILIFGNKFDEIVFEADVGFRVGDGLAGQFGAYVDCEQGGRDLAVSGQNNRPFDRVLHFPDVARPSVAFYGIQSIIRQDGLWAAQFASAAAKKMLGEQLDVRATLAQWWWHQGHDIQAIVKILPKAPGFNQRLQLARAGANQSHVGGLGVGCPKPTILSGLDYVQELRLGPGGEAP